MECCTKQSLNSLSHNRSHFCVTKKKMRGTAQMNAMRSAVVVFGAMAFGYLTLKIGFKPYLEKAELEQQRREAILQAESITSQDKDNLVDSSSGLPESDQKL